MSERRFTWDPKKAASNLIDHDVSFDEAAESFGDPLGDPERDWEHGEPRMVLIAHTRAGRLLFTVFGKNPNEKDATHIISSRKATSHERARYQRGTPSKPRRSRRRRRH